MKLKRHFLTLMTGVSLAVCVMTPGQARAPVRNEDSSASAGEVRARADQILAQMTPEEKAGQLSQYFYMSMAPDMLKTPVEVAIAQGRAGGIVYESDPHTINRLQRIAVENSRMKIPLLFSFDVIHGFHTIFPVPVPVALAASWDPALVERVQSAAAAEASQVGVKMTFAPMVDVSPDPRWGRIVEGAGEDPYLGAAMARAQVRGFQGNVLGAPGHVVAVTKHFAGYGASLGGRDYDQVDLPRSELWNVYFPPFKAAVDAGAGGIMSAYMPLNGIAPAANRWLLTEVLRKTWDFQGIVLSDSNAVSALVTQGLAENKGDAAARAVHAGLDMELVPPMLPSAMAGLPNTIQEGLASQREVDDAVRLVLELKIRLGLFEHPYVDNNRKSSNILDAAHLKLAEDSAERSAVLLKNVNALLPLDRKYIKSIAVIGPLADSPRDALGPWVFPQTAPVMSSILQGIRDKAGKSIRVDYALGVVMPSRTYPSPMAMVERMFAKTPVGAAGHSGEKTDIGAAVKLAVNADVAVLVLGESQDMIGESASRSTLNLPGQQKELLDAVVATGKPVIVLLMSGRPLNLGESRAKAVMEIWYPGSAAGSAVANLLFGDAVPGGKLPFTWIRTAGQAPNPYAHLGSHAPAGADQRYWNGSSAPTYPFGYGLSYTTFQYSNLKVGNSSYAKGQAVDVSVDLKNTGTRAGDEVAQLYIHQRYGASARPVRELKGFQRVTLRAGESRTLHFKLSPEDLRYWSEATGGWTQDATIYDIWVGGNEQANLAAQFATTK